MKARAILMTVALVLSSQASSQTTLSDPDQVANDIFWNRLYQDGGKTFFCQEPFNGKSFLLSVGYIYPLSHVRNALHCGSPTQCERESDAYRYIASDLHNMIPVETQVEMRRRNAKYAQLDERVSANECGIRESLQNIEPPDAVKGDVARGVAYMVQTYDLPLIASPQVLASWNESDPPDDQELARNRRISEIQGSDNPFISHPERLDGNI
ncbi:endonuclease I [Marinobacter halodurans]|uniref:Endonuclease I n=1 Tax=Marinobacter halodurans TaxID=2528979 RepID=A0ABY1ZR13_9GAMM|nr:endonuclease [Marinobacter halodurans]TBW56843.1 endonuclease I [Marinobacter halodurans]